MKGYEIERKFLLKELPEQVREMPGVMIEQAYLSTDPELVTRVRTLSTGEAFLTVKGKAKGISRREIETPIDREAAQEMISMSRWAPIKKIRRKVQVGGKTWEVDEFLEANQGLLVAEVELESETEDIEMPAWVGKEVSEEHRYSNAALANDPFTTWARSPKP